MQFLPAVQVAVWPAAQPAGLVGERAELAAAQRAVLPAGRHFAGQTQAGPLALSRAGLLAALQAESLADLQMQPEPLVRALALWPEPQQERCWGLMWKAPYSQASFPARRGSPGSCCRMIPIYRT